jgi:hypothetical protein
MLKNIKISVLSKNDFKIIIFILVVLNFNIKVLVMVRGHLTMRPAKPKELPTTAVKGLSVVKK